VKVLFDYIAPYSDEAIIQLKINVCTWAPFLETKILQIRSAALARTKQYWGVSEISEIPGEPFEGLTTTVPAVASHSIATPTDLPFL
jgi:intracellular multiplication protein IcmB